jgi:hypothetical protein
VEDSRTRTEVGHSAGAVFVRGLARGSALAGLGNPLDGQLHAGVMMSLGAFLASRGWWPPDEPDIPLWVYRVTGIVSEQNAE